MASNYLIQNEHAKNYIEAEFAERLRQEGFRCPDDRLLCWYRVINEEVIQSIVFFAVDGYFPMFMNIGCGAFPIFRKPVYTKKVVFPERPIDFERFWPQNIVEDVHRPTTLSDFSPNIWVMAPNGEGRGIYTLDKIILPEFAQATSVESCYQYHINKRLSLNVEKDELKFKSISDVFINEAFIFEDTVMYPFCVRRIEEMVSIREYFCQKAPKNKVYAEELNIWRRLREAFSGGDREAYLSDLSARKEDTIRYLNKLGVM